MREHLPIQNSRLHVIAQDPSDNKFLELARESKADYILSGDSHLLELKTFRSIRIITPNEFFESGIDT